MNSRDSRFGTDHFQDFIERSQATLDRHPGYVKALREIVSGIYSAGYPLEQVRASYIDYLKEVSSSMATTYPNGIDVLNLMSFALMLGVHDDERDMLAAVAAKDNCGEPFYAFLEDALGLEHPLLTGKKGTWKFFPTLQAIPDKEGKQDFIATYLKRNWYNSWRSEYWWGEHQGGAIRYFGYWAWEFGALVKAWGLDDSSFRGNRYYPADMAHYLDQN